jgi:peptide/nickel transport system permease protein
MIDAKAELAREAAPTPWEIVLGGALRHRGFQIGVTILLILLVVAVFALVTDAVGRDDLSQLVLRTWISLLVGFGAATLGMCIGAMLGVLAGVFGGVVDHAVSFVLTAQLALPSLLLAMALVFIIGPSVRG